MQRWKEKAMRRTGELLVEDGGWSRFCDSFSNSLC